MVNDQAQAHDMTVLTHELAPENYSRDPYRAAGVQPEGSSPAKTKFKTWSSETNAQLKWEDIKKAILQKAH